MRNLEELVDPADGGWALVERWRSGSTRWIEVLGCHPARASATLYAAQVTTASPMGAIALHCGGLLIDHGWIRILGSGHGRLGDGLREWNESLGGDPLNPPAGKALVVAYDALGGFFVLNGGRWPDQELGGIRYLAPDTTGWQILPTGYSGFVEWSMSGDLDGFYEGQRWAGWEAEIEAIGPDRGLHIYPPLGFEEVPIAERSRRQVPARELWSYHQSMAEQLAGLPDGAQVKFVVDE